MKLLVLDSRGSDNASYPTPTLSANKKEKDVSFETNTHVGREAVFQKM